MARPASRRLFLTPHGVKLLDFGLARTRGPEPAHSLASIGDLTFGTEPLQPARDLGLIGLPGESSHAPDFR